MRLNENFKVVRKLNNVIVQVFYSNMGITSKSLRGSLVSIMGVLNNHYCYDVTVVIRINEI